MATDILKLWPQIFQNGKKKELETQLNDVS